MSSSETDVYEDEPEVELRDVTLKQDIVESEESPRLLLYVKRDNDCQKEKSVPFEFTSYTSENQNNQEEFLKITAKEYKNKISLDVTNKSGKQNLFLEQKGRDANIIKSARNYTPDFSELTSKYCKSKKAAASKSLKMVSDKIKDNFEIYVSRNACTENINTFNFVENNERDSSFCQDGAKIISKNTNLIIENSNPNNFRDFGDEDIFNNLCKFKDINDVAKSKEENNHTCQKCNHVFKRKSHLATHCRTHIKKKDFECNECGICFKTKSSLYFHMKRHIGAPFICKVCNKEYAERKQLMRHNRVVHLSVNLFPCYKCEKSFKTRQAYQLHSLVHTGEKRFQCDICQKTFFYKSALIYHVSSHQVEKEFKCDQCPKEYAVCTEFKRHYINHTSNRPFKCNTCGKSFPLKGTLKNHIKIHSPEKPFKCNFCDKTFMKKQSLICHTMAHNGETPKYLCDKCSKTYYNEFALKRHYIKHTEERQFVCEICKKAFWMKDALKVHKRTHENIKQYICSKCMKIFAHKHSFNRHMKLHENSCENNCPVCHKLFYQKVNFTCHIKTCNRGVSN